MKKIYLFILCFSFLSFSITSQEINYEVFYNILRFENQSTITDNLHTKVSELKVFSDNTIEILCYGVWSRHHLTPVDKDNTTFLITDEDTSHIIAGYRTNKTFNLFNCIIFDREYNMQNSHKILNQIYSQTLDDNYELKLKINDDNSICFFDEGEWIKEGYVSHFDEDHNLQFSVYNNSTYPEVMGFFSPDGEKLYLGYGDQFLKKDAILKITSFINPQLTIESINISDINFETSSNDLLLMYPTCRVEKEGDIIKYSIDDFPDIDLITFSFYKNKLSKIEEKKTDSGNSNGTVNSLVQRKVKELTEKYGKPEILEYSYDYSKYNTDHYYSYHITRDYIWNGEMGIKLSYEYYDRKGTVSKPSCKIVYCLDVFDLE